MGEYGILIQCFMFFLKALKYVFKAAVFTGFWWFAVPLGAGIVYESVTGTYINDSAVMLTIFDFLFYSCFVLCPLTFIQNLIRMVKKDRTFSFLKVILNRKEKKGIEATADGKTVAMRTAADLSGVVFGKLGGKYVTMPESADGHILVIGGIGSGKSAAIAIPTLMSWKERVFAIDIKGELYAKTRNARNPAQIKVFNPTDRGAYGYDPFYVLKHTDDFSGEARSLALSICPLPAETKDPFWIKGAQNMLTGFIVYLVGQGLNFSEAMKFIKSQPVRQLITLIMNDTEPEAEKARIEISQFDGMDDKTLSGVFTELSNHITVFAADDNLQRALSGEGNCITPADLENGYDIFCCIPEHKIEQWKDLLGMMCNQFLKSFERRPEENRTPILFLIDEFPRLGKIETVCSGLATLRSKKIHIVLVVQSKSQLNVTYGKDMASVIMDTCPYKAILGTGDADMQEYCSKLVGTYDKAKTSSNYNADMIGIGKGQGTSKSTEEKRIIKPEEFAYLGDDVVCLFPMGYKRLTKTSCYEIESPFFDKLPPDVQEESKRRLAMKSKK